MKEPKTKLIVSKSTNKKTLHNPYHLEVVALRVIHRYQGSTELLIRKLLFQRLVVALAKYCMIDLCLFHLELLVLQAASETYLIALFRYINPNIMFKKNILNTCNLIN